MADDVAQREIREFIFSLTQRSEAEGYRVMEQRIAAEFEEHTRTSVSSGLRRELVSGNGPALTVNVPSFIFSSSNSFRSLSSKVN